jgi:hypothetical protein
MTETTKEAASRRNRRDAVAWRCQQHHDKCPIMSPNVPSGEGTWDMGGIESGARRGALRGSLWLAVTPSPRRPGECQVLQMSRMSRNVALFWV